MKIKKIVLTTLLIVFTFLVVHDYTLVHFDPETQAEISCNKVHQNSMDAVSLFHDHIHSELLYMDSLSLKNFVLQKSSDRFEETSYFLFLSSLSLERPPNV